MKPRGRNFHFVGAKPSAETFSRVSFKFPKLLVQQNKKNQCRNNKKEKKTVKKNLWGTIFLFVNLLMSTENEISR